MIFTLSPAQRIRTVTTTFLLLLTCLTPLVAQERYGIGSRVNGTNLLCAPPAVGSKEYAADLAAARQIFKRRTPAEEARAMKHAKLTIFNFTPAIGDFFQPGKFPKTEKFFQDIRPEVKPSIDLPKEHWKRQRPYQVDPSLSLGKEEPSASYPSGHSTFGTVMALLLSELFPEKREGILEIGREIGYDRVVIGKHFLTDMYAGRVLAQAIVRELMASPQFQKDFAELKAEVQEKALAVSK